MTSELSIATTLHGRVLVETPKQPSSRVLVGFHGYAETADMQMDRLRSIESGEDWCRVSIQGLHRFYRRQSQDVVASWMTRQDRESMIADNNAYVANVVETVLPRLASVSTLVFVGFSQGVATAFRAACKAGRRVDAAICFGGDVPPEIERNELARITSVLIGRGDEDMWYSASTFESDLHRLSDAGIALEAITCRGGHEWTAEWRAAIATFLRRLESQ